MALVIVLYGMNYIASDLEMFNCRWEIETEKGRAP
jgi:hypothetical protein